MGAAAVRGAISLDCPEPFSVFGRGASLSSAMTISFVVEEPEIEPITGAQASVPARRAGVVMSNHELNEPAKRRVANAAESAASKRNMPLLRNSRGGSRPRDILNCGSRYRLIGTVHRWTIRAQVPEVRGGVGA